MRPRPARLDGPTFFAALDAATTPYEVVALGGTLDARTLLAAYRAGCFPWPAGGPDVVDPVLLLLARRGSVALLAGPDEAVPWCSPEPRAVLMTSPVAVPRSLRQRLRRCGWTTTVDTAFEQVLAACADRPETWITARMRAAYTELAAAGDAHSLEVWDGPRLVGGLYGVQAGGVFSGESMFHRESDAGKVAVVDLCARLAGAGIPLLDTQQESPHLRALGQVLVTRAEYVRAVAALRDVPARVDAGRLGVARLA